MNKYRFLQTIFKKLSESDFQSDKFLNMIYYSYQKENQKTQHITLCDFYIEYLLSYRHHTENKEDEIQNICNSIVEKILHPDADNLTDSGSADIQPSSNKKIFRFNKKNVLTILSEFVQSSHIILHEEDEIYEQGRQHEDFHESITQNIINEIKAERGSLPQAIQDQQFIKRNELLEVWRDTEMKCRKLLENEKMAQILQKIYFIDARQICLNNYQAITTIEYDEDQEIETLMPNWPKQSYNTQISVINKHPIEIACQSKSSKCVIICPGSQMISGGGADQGIETAESVYYYATSYSICTNQIMMKYPLQTYQLLIMPNILLFKNHNSPTYVSLSPIDSQRLSIIMVPGIYRPKTNISNQDNYTMDHRLFHKAAKYTNQTLIQQQLQYVFNTALFFGYDTIIIDDYGINDFWLPLHHTAQLIAQAINNYRGKFKEIIVAIKNPTLYNIFNQYIR